jgi:3-phosphoshikimate 1-carboxyvinyltransferase
MASADSYAGAELPPVSQPPHRVYVRAGSGRPPVEPITIQLPGSKYYTLRYLLVALLAEGESLVRNPALSDDTAVLVRALHALGATARWERLEPDGWQLRVRGTGGQLRVPSGGVIQAGNAGAVLRLLLGLGTLLPDVRFETDHPDSLGRRPNADLLDALRALGIAVEACEPGGLLPITLRGGPPSGGAVTISGARSSQYLSALLYLAPLLREGLEITVADTLRSAPLVRATLRALAAAGIRVEAAPDLRRFIVPGQQIYRAGIYDVPGDAPSAAALAAAAITAGVPAQLETLDPAEEDVRALLDALDAVGAPIVERPGMGGGPLVIGPGRLLGAHVDGDAIIDSVPVLVAAACFAQGESRFENVATLRLKESDRIGDLCAELRRAGCDIEPLPDAIVVHGRPEGIPGGVVSAGHDDHRLVQALAIAALRSQHGLIIEGADAVAKSYPGFFGELVRLGARVEVEVRKTPYQLRDEARANGERLMSHEIMDASHALSILADQFRALSDQEAERVVLETERRFVQWPNLRWWWEAFRCRGLATGDLPFGEIAQIVPPLEPAYLIANLDAGSPEPPLVYEGATAAILAVLGECRHFEFYLVARDLSWLICQNHHDNIYALGFSAMRRLTQYARQHPEVTVHTVRPVIRHPAENRGVWGPHRANTRERGATFEPYQALP